MSLPKDFGEQLPRKTDQELYDLLAHPDDYLPEALEAARGELSQRNLPPERAGQLAAAAQSKHATEEAKAQERLSWPMRLLIVIFCVGLAGILLAVYYDSKGYKQKARDCWVTLGVVVVAYLVVGGLLYLME
jgi:hypothetical protein